MKFVKGDAIAAIVITLINIIGGLVIGVAMRDMSFMQALQTYSILTIGNGLVAQIPALLISISAGMVVTRVASENEDANLGKDVATQILAQPKAIAVASGILLLLALVPGLPKIPFFLLAALTGSVSYGLFRAIAINKSRQEEVQEKAELSAEPDLTVTVPLVLEVGEDLTRYVDIATPEGQQLYGTLVEVRKSLYYELGVIFPPMQVSGNNPYGPGVYKIWLNEVPVITSQLRTDVVMVNDTAKNLFIYGLKAEETRNPANGKPAAWISRDQRDRAVSIALQVWDTHEILAMHVTYFLRKHAKDFLGLQEVHWMVQRLREFYPTLVDEVSPKPISLQQLTEILQRLVEEGVSIRDLKSIFQSLGRWASSSHETAALTEHVRAALKEKICYQLSGGQPALYVYQLDPEIEEMVRTSIRTEGSASYLSMEPSMIQQVIDAAYAQIGQLPVTAQKPVILTDNDIRRFVKRLLDFSFPDLSVISYDQLSTEVSTYPLGVIALLQPANLAGEQQAQLGAGS